MRIFSVHYVYTSFSQMHELPQILKTGEHTVFMITYVLGLSGFCVI